MRTIPVVLRVLRPPGGKNEKMPGIYHMIRATFVALRSISYFEVYCCRYIPGSNISGGWHDMVCGLMYVVSVPPGWLKKREGCRTRLVDVFFAVMDVQERVALID